MFFLIWTLGAVLCIAAAEICSPRRTVEGDERGTVKIIGADSQGGMGPISLAGGVFLLISFISMLISPYREAAFFGSEGRYQGFLTLMVYGIMVALISRYPVKTKGFIGCFLLGGAVVLGIGACQYLLLDPFGLVARIQEFERYMFFSTIGYTNFYSCYAAMVTVIAMGVCGVGAGKMKLHRLWSIRRPQEWSRADTQW